jgi:adenylate cyclase
VAGGGRARRRWIQVGGCVAIAAALAALAAAGSAAGSLAGFQERAADSIYPRGTLSSDVVVVAIDSRALARHDQQWPWPRAEQARLVEAVASGRPAVVVIDELFASSADGDDELAAQVARATSTGSPVVRAGVADVGGRDHGVLVASSTIPPDATIAAGAFATGLTTVTPDPNDGVVRQVPLTVEVDGVFRPSLALAAIAAVDGSTPDVVVRPGGVQVGRRTIPTGTDHQLRISWPAGLDHGSPAVVSAADVLAGQVDPSTFRDKAVFVGVTDPTLGDTHLTPLDRATGQPGVEIQAAAFHTMASRHYLEPASTAVIAIEVFVVALVVALAVQLLPLWAAAAASIVAPVTTVAWAWWRADAGTVTNVVFPLVAAVIAVLASGGLRYAVETRHRRQVSRLFAQYVPGPIAEQHVDEGRVDDAVAGQRLDVTVLFCDLRGFTAMSAQVSPEAVNERLSRYYEYASEIVLGHGGTLVQYVGDEVFAVFGAPIAQVDHRASAVACARQLQVDVDRLDAVLAEAGAPPLRFGIGLCAGPVVAAHAGSTWRRQYAVIGDTVNVGSRLCSQAGPGEVVLAESVRAGIDPPPEVDPMGPLRMKGVADDFVAWRLVLDG